MLTFNKTYCKETVQKGTKSQVAGVLSALVEKVGGFSCCCRSFSSHTQVVSGGFRVLPHRNLRRDVGLSFLQKNKL